MQRETRRIKEAVSPAFQSAAHLHIVLPPGDLAINTPRNKLHEPEMISDKAECKTLKSGEMFDHAN